MVGNDVVDLRDPDADPKTLHPRFDRRVFRPEERRSIAQSSDPARQRWRLWAAKEAAFKLLHRLDPAISFSPIRFAVTLDEQRGSVRFAGRELELRVIDGEGSVHALTSLPGQARDGLVHGLWRLDAADPRLGEPEGPGHAARELACRALASLLGEHAPGASPIEVRREGRIPSFWRDGVRLPVALSLSHHGELVAFALRRGRELATGRSASASRVTAALSGDAMAAVGDAS